MQGHFELREEGDGDAAWQTLVLDPSIRGVISDLQMPKLDGYGLLERLRASKLKRLQQMPFILVSGEEAEAERVKAASLGVSDFITKGSGSAEILVRLKNLLALSEAQESLAARREDLVQDPETGLYTRKYLALQAEQAVAHGLRYAAEVSAMLIGFDAYDALGQRLGALRAAEVAGRFARSLAERIRREDSLGHFSDGQFAVISPGTALAHCATFAERVRQAVEVARLSVQGQDIALTVSIGVASLQADCVKTGEALLDCANERMQAAMASGGNRVDSGGVAAATRSLSLPRALELLGLGRVSAVQPHVGELTRQLMPLLQLLEKEFGLALPLAELEHRIIEREIKNQ